MIFFLYKKIKSSPSGFTLVEMLITLGLFSFIMTLATTVLYSTQAINVKLQETQSVLDNVNISLEVMSRDIRYGSDFYCSSTLEGNNFLLRKDCPYTDVGANHGGKYLFFKPVDAETSKDRVVYYASTTLSGNVILKDEYFDGKATSTYQVTADDVKINSLVFYVSGADSTSAIKNLSGVSNYEQPLVITTVAGESMPVAEGASSTKFMVETSISSRVLDN